MGNRGGVARSRSRRSVNAPLTRDLCRLFADIFLRLTSNSLNQRPSLYNDDTCLWNPSARMTHKTRARMVQLVFLYESGKGLELEGRSLLMEKRQSINPPHLYGLPPRNTITEWSCPSGQFHPIPFGTNHHVHTDHRRRFEADHPGTFSESLPCYSCKINFNLSCISRSENEIEPRLYEPSPGMLHIRVLTQG
ncbi:hypothetical protein PV11_01344 [Exophiala sideris]|uniref:Uncharacterized protein n=1 Tax=Exophiala sideris TaxID=1016849 RepID=A0A0D1YSQ9_9EURO|nr:hypothetical protein PV11_01344 [Exophiala sideris]